MHTLRAYHIAVVLVLAILLVIAKYADHGEHFRTLALVFFGILIGHIGEAIAWSIYKK